MTVTETLVSERAAILFRISENISRVFVGKQEQMRVLLTSFAAGLHVLIEDVPGVGKTTLARCLAKSVGLDFGRIQFTPDLLPGDVVGMTIWSQDKKEFLYKQGAIMHQFVLADEINRASPRTQSSLLEAMQEQSVTVDGHTYALPQPFFVIATQNPVHFLGAFALPEGELDRFGVSLSLGYPSEVDENEILERFQETDPLENLLPVSGDAEICEVREIVRKIHVSAKVRSYIVQISKASRQNRDIKLGLSPRASLHLLLAAQATAFFNRRTFVIPEDVQLAAPNVLSHRLTLSSEAQMKNVSTGEVVQKLVEGIDIPTGLHEQ